MSVQGWKTALMPGLAIKAFKNLIVKVMRDRCVKRCRNGTEAGFV